MPENFDLYLEVQGRVTADTLDEVIDEVRGRLASAGDSPFSEAAASSFTNPLEEVHGWLTNSAAEMAAKTDLKCLYAEMNGFDINTDRWFSDLFGYATEIDYTRAYELPYDLANSGGMASTLTLIGMESMQRAFEWWRENEDLWATNADSETLAQLLVECRFIELLRNACSLGPLQPDVPLAAGAHESGMIIRVN